VRLIQIHSSVIWGRNRGSMTSWNEDGWATSSSGFHASFKPEVSLAGRGSTSYTLKFAEGLFLSPLQIWVSQEILISNSMNICPGHLESTKRHQFISNSLEHLIGLLGFCWEGRKKPAFLMVWKKIKVINSSYKRV